MQLTMFISHGRSDIRSGSDRVFQIFGYFGYPFGYFLHIGLGSDSFSSGSVISDRVRIFQILNKEIKIFITQVSYT